MTASHSQHPPRRPAHTKRTPPHASEPGRPIPAGGRVNGSVPNSPSGTWPHPISATAADLFETLGETFTVDALFDAGAEAGLSAEASARCLRAFLKHDMVVQTACDFSQTGRKPYF